MIRPLHLAALLMLLACGPARAGDTPFTPTSDYDRDEIRGFRLLIHPEAASHEAEFRAARQELEKQLGDIVRLVPHKPLAALRKVPIWIEWEAKPGGAAEFHPSASWLKAHGYNPEKAGGIEINNLRHFVDWSHRAQPAMILHEMAHAYHHLVLGPDDPRIARAFDRAKASGKYDEVGYFDGGKKKAYAMNNRFEFFAEMTEAYLLKNDFEPFDREGLKAFDPESYRLLADIWR